MTGPSKEPPNLSDYEVNRARNIERNNAKLRLLGLITVIEEKRSNAAAWKQPAPALPAAQLASSSETHDSDNDDFVPSPSPRAHKKRKLQSTTLNKSEPVRKSLRQRGLRPENGSGKDGSSPAISSTPLSSSSSSVVSPESREQARRQWVEECREARQRAALQYASLGAAAAAKQNPTATYDHCLMRVRTMTTKALENRIKAIERATGKHCVVKMAIFKSCLQDEDEWELSEKAGEALERLKALLPPPIDK